MFTNQDVDSLVISAKEGDRRAVEFLINDNMDIVYAKARNYYIKGMGTDDVLQEGRVGLYKAIRNYRPERNASFRGFCQMCVQRQLISAIKKANRRKHGPLNNSTSIDKKLDRSKANSRKFSEILPDKSEDLEKKLVYRELIDLISNDLKKILTELERSVFLEFLKSKSYKEIAGILEVEVKAVDNALQRARRKLEEVRHDYDIGDLVS
ncbi:MAG: sigma-70 family RNA polymerase sigma factor [Halanaerobiaceae bacterium]